MRVVDFIRHRHSQVRLILFATICTAVAAITLAARGGLSYVNLDSVLEEPHVFFMFLALPTLVGVACVIAATLPKLVTINIALIICLATLLEAGAWLLTPAPPVIQGKPEAAGASTFHLRDPTLGYVMAPSVSARHRRTVDGHQIYDVVYRTDAWGRRETPISSGSRKQFLLFFGDSNTFGEGLSQTETLPYFAGEMATAYRPYNYGVSGYGPSNVLALARRGNLRQEVAEREGYAVFFFIPAHVGRVVGSSKVSTGWGRHFPRFVENERGELISRGDFVHGRPFTTLLYFISAKSNLTAYFGVELPLWYTRSDYRLTAKVLKEASRVVSQQLHLRDFVVVLGQFNNEAERRMIREMRDALGREGVSYLDYTELFDTRDVRYRLSDTDFHNSALANHIIATGLVAALAEWDSRGL